MRHLDRRTLVRAAVGAAVLAGPWASGRAQAYPAKPIKLIVGFPPAGASDVIARLVATKMSDGLGQPVVVENRPGANGTLAAGVVAKSAPDGYTLAWTGPGSISMGPLIYKERLNYDVVRDFVPVGMVATFPLVLVVRPAAPYKTMAEFVQYAKANAASMQFGSFGNGSPSHLASEMLKQQLGVKILHVPYAGSAPAITALMGDQVHALFDTVSSAAPHIRSGRIAALGVTARQRMPQLPAIPTLIESGFPNFEAGGWTAIHAPAGTPDAIVQQLNGQVVRALASPDVVERLATLGAQPAGGSPAALAEFCRTETLKMAELVRTAGIKLD